MNLFENNLTTYQPLAERMRPRNFDDFIGHEHIIGPQTLLRRLIDNDELVSLIFWAPPGSGKTTLARMIAHKTQARFVSFSAVTGGVKQLREEIKQAHDQLLLHKKRTILFVDEIHRFNKSQQDYFLPFVENGTVTLIGATTENPSFEVNSALLSRCKVFKLNALNPQNIADILVQALGDAERGYGTQKIIIEKDTIRRIAILANGDARMALNTLEFAVKSAEVQKNGNKKIRHEDIEQIVQKNIAYDKDGEEHYNIISALHKSLRGSDVQAAVYWLGRMLDGGEDPLYIARRLIRFASEDIGIADVRALEQAVAAYQACHYIGMPECGVVLGQCVVYLAQAPKNVAVYRAYKKVQQTLKSRPSDPVPLHIRNGVTALMRDAGYGDGYKYNPDYNEPIEQDYLPKALQGEIFFEDDNNKIE